MKTHNLTTPISEGEIRGLKVGDAVYISGQILTARDQAHLRAVEYAKMKKKVPGEFEGSVLFHCGPIVKKINGDWAVISAGPTTSSRMESLEHEFIRRFKVRMIIGKGGMGAKTAEAMKEFKAVYCSFTGGAGAFAAKAIQKVEKVEWLDLGIPEAVWVFKVREFGPMIVSMDSYGGNLYDETNTNVMQNYQKILRSRLKRSW